MVKKIVEPESIWDYFQTHQLTLRAEMTVAYNHEYGTEITLSEEGGKPVLMVYADGDCVCCENAEGKAECEEVASRLYDDYLTERVIDTLSEDYSDYLDGDGMSRFDANTSIEDREIDLDDALYAFLEAVFCDMDSDYVFTFFDDEKLSDLKDHILEYIARKYDMPIYRPMILEDEDGNDFFEEYPYGCMIFEDEDNPIYK